MKERNYEALVAGMHRKETFEGAEEVIRKDFKLWRRSNGGAVNGGARKALIVKCAFDTQSITTRWPKEKRRKLQAMRNNY